jgi:hypothetical protein
MSTQLILYPQSYEGVFNSTSTILNNQYIVNGFYFTGLNSTTLFNTTSVSPALAAIASTPPAVLGNWYRYTTTGGPWGAVTAPQVASGNLLLSYNASIGHTGVYQKLSGLVAGGVFDIIIDIATPAVGTLTIQIYSGNLLQSTSSITSNLNSITSQFTANTANDIILLNYSSTAGALLINSIKVNESAWIPTTIYSEIEDGQVICDLYEEEDIPLTLSIDDFKNVAEKVQSYSKDFNLPATKRNNQIFNNMYEVTRADDGLIFNPYVKTKCVLKQDGFILFEGYLRMLDVKDKEGEISYNVNLYSEVIALADVLKDSKFSDLDFTELTHDYNKTQITRSWNESPDASITYTNPSTSGFRETYDTLRYPFIDWTHQYLIGGTGGASAATPGNPELTSLEQAFRPCIQLKYLINRIFAASGFNWTSDFFDSADFEKLYMDFNWGGDNIPANVTGSSYAGQAPYAATIYLLPLATATFSNLQLANYQNNAYVTPPNYNQTSNILTATQINETYEVDYYYQVNCTAGDTVEFQWLHTYSTGTTTIDATSILSVTSINFWQGNFTIVMQPGDTLQAQFKTDGANTWQYSTFSSTVIFTHSISAVTSQPILQTLRGELGQWDFLKGIMTMFNLVTMVDENDPDNILIEPYSDVFINNTNSGNTGNLTLAARSIQHDWTDKVDVSEMELKPLTNLNKHTVFQFVEDEDDYCFKNYKISTSGHLYGSKELDASTSSNGQPTILQGTEEIIAEPFAATVSKPLMSQFPNFIVPSIYAMTDEGTSEGFENSPRIFYNNGIKSTGASYFIPEQNGLASGNPTDFLQFSHLSDIPTVAGSRDFVFESQQLFTGVGAPPTDNLYSVYWQPYFNELYNADTRTMTLKVNLSPSDVAAFKFYDTVFIKNRVFRVNKIEYKPNDLAKVEFILIP